MSKPWSLGRSATLSQHTLQCSLSKINEHTEHTHTHSVPHDTDTHTHTHTHTHTQNAVIMGKDRDQDAGPQVRFVREDEPIKHSGYMLFFGQVINLTIS